MVPDFDEYTKAHMRYVREWNALSGLR
jgi:hypothetical protein